jgi:hypothetical protein
VEILRDTKSIFVDNPVELFTKGSGGSEFTFYRRQGLEQAIEQIGDQLHSQYLISYNPNDKGEGGFHRIEVQVAGRSDVARVQTRPGYWLAAKFN